MAQVLYLSKRTGWIWVTRDDNSILCGVVRGVTEHCDVVPVVWVGAGLGSEAGRCAGKRDEGGTHLSSVLRSDMGPKQILRAPCGFYHLLWEQDHGIFFL